MNICVESQDSTLEYQALLRNDYTLSASSRNEAIAATPPEDGRWRLRFDAGDGYSLDVYCLCDTDGEHDTPYPEAEYALLKAPGGVVVRIIDHIYSQYSLY